MTTFCVSLLRAVQIRRHSLVPLCSVLLLACLSGCAQRETQLARVAKDWSLVIRASQVIPVYPLTEDLVPGDLFLVRMSIPQQHREYQQRGFLPMDLHLTRLRDVDFASGYANSYGTKDRKNTPYHWQFPPEGTAPATLDELRRFLESDSSWTGTGGEQPVAAGTSAGAGASGGGSPGPAPKSLRHKDPSLWHTAPRAAFPSYSFEINSKTGLGAALPLQGVPVALSLMQTHKAFGTATLSDVYTYGVPHEKLFGAVHAWASVPENRQLLKEIRAGVNKGNTWASVFDSMGRVINLDSNERTAYLRVVSRVYLVGSVNVSLIDVEAGALDGQAGAKQNVQVLDPLLKAPTPPSDINSAHESRGGAQSAPDAAPRENAPPEPADKPMSYAAALEHVSQNIGVGTQVQWATSRSVAMNETFDRPLVIGYLGFDFPITADGGLGTPVATQTQLESGAVPEEVSALTPAARAHSYASISALIRSAEEMAGNGDREAQARVNAFDQAARELQPPASEFFVYDWDRGSQSLQKHPYAASDRTVINSFLHANDVLEYLLALDRSIKALDRAIASDVPTKGLAGMSEQELRNERESQEAMLRELGARFLSLDSYRDLVEFVLM